LRDSGEEIGLLAPKLEILPRPQRLLWDELGATPGWFVLYGGTALALRLGHRQSEDFDFFSNRPFTGEELLAGLPYLGKAQVVQLGENTLTCAVERGGRVQVSFFGGLDLCRVQDPELAPGNGIQVASLVDLAGCKAAVIQQRAEKKDYVDLASILKSGTALETVLAAGKAIFGVRFDPEITCRALASFVEGDLKQIDTAVRENLLAAVSMVKLKQLPTLAGRPGVCIKETKG
jgi:nucleotidyltransferase AbiEii toxin of type IV toxin-antitoxin system